MTISIKQTLVLGLILLLAACADTPKSVNTPPHPALPPPPAKLGGLNQVMGHSAGELTALFGTPEQDLREVNGRRLQFSGGKCVLDAFLYPPVPGRDAVVTYVEARTPDGRDSDRAECVTALMRSRGR